ncbi:hypothetical protein [Sporolactobacillus laevolacticus]|uniref:hypothetical protein n=1 Tax=Sporolactobacillus laevolacticus TaxID=33018 RepID=UPI0025B44A08|nr:hypothetical protein [Sporolactobacillus laevolacticus]MDN3955186.1 hypothetical protein [Sporolactobacillus laevolacticus]
MKRIVVLLISIFLIILSGCSAHSPLTSSSAVKGSSSNTNQNADSTNHSSLTNKDNNDDQNAEDNSDADADQNSVNGHEGNNTGSTSHPTKSYTNNNSSSINTNDNDQNAQARSSSKTTSTGNVSISTSVAAKLYLRHQLKMDNNNDILFDDMGGFLDTDKKGSYYMIKLTSKSLRKKGGSGTVGLYKVYTNGTYELAY